MVVLGFGKLLIQTCLLGDLNWQLAPDKAAKGLAQLVNQKQTHN